MKEINIKTDGKIIMAFTDPVDGDENPYKYFTDNFTGEGVHAYHIFNTPKEFVTKWLEIYNKPNGMWYWVLDGDKCICSGACDPDDIHIFRTHWNLIINYKVKLYEGKDEMMPYEINVTDVYSEEDAKQKAKEIIADIGYFGAMTKEEIIKRLTVKNVTVGVV